MFTLIKLGKHSQVFSWVSVAELDSSSVFQRTVPSPESLTTT